MGGLFFPEDVAFAMQCEISYTSCVGFIRQTDVYNTLGASMRSYHYRTSLRIWHPSIEPALISKATGLEPCRSWRVGEQRATPKGKPQEGTYPESYWYSDLSGENPENADNLCLEDSLWNHLEQLEGASEFLRSVRETGGRCEIFVGLYGRWNYAFEFSPPLLSRVSHLGLALSLDIYPNIEGP